MDDVRRLQDRQGQWHVVRPILCGHCGCLAYIDGPHIWDPGEPPDHGCPDPDCRCHVSPRQGDAAVADRVDVGLTEGRRCPEAAAPFGTSPAVRSRYPTTPWKKYQPKIPDTRYISQCTSRHRPRRIAITV
jgi:hypothetical protein